jgi:hypothetical protein
MVNAVAATPISIPRPIRLQKMPPLTQMNQSQQIATPLPFGSIVDCFFKSQSGNTLLLTLEYMVDPEVKAPVYVGGWLYEGRQKAVDIGYTPTRVATLPQGTVDLPLVLNTQPFTSIYAEVFLIQNGKVFGKSQFTFPYTWDGTSGKFMVSENPLPADQQTTKPGQSSMQTDGKKLFCRQYADAAVAQFNMGLQYRLGGITPPVWSNDKNGHFSWCM